MRHRRRANTTRGVLFASNASRRRDAHKHHDRRIADPEAEFRHRRRKIVAARFGKSRNAEIITHRLHPISGSGKAATTLARPGARGRLFACEGNWGTLVS
jgi:hypothetical protein